MPWISALNYLIIWNCFKFKVNHANKLFICTTCLTFKTISWQLILLLKEPKKEPLELLKRARDPIHRGYYMVARRYEFYVRVARTISHEWAQQTSEILFLPREHKIHIFELMCNVLFIIWRLSKQQTRREKPIQQKQKAGIVTSLNDTTLTKVTYTENTPLGSRMKWRMESTSRLVPSKTDSPPYNKRHYVHAWI